MRVAVFGHMGRDEAAVDRLQGHEIHILGQWRQPGLAEAAKNSGGTISYIKELKDVEGVADWVEGIEPDMFFTNFDDALMGTEKDGGVVDAIRRRVNAGRMSELLIPSPDRKAAKIEWDKFLLREILEEIYQETGVDYNPDHERVTNKEELRRAIDRFEAAGHEVAIKPRFPTGGKGVKVMGVGKHFATYEGSYKYGEEVIDSESQGSAEVQRRQDDEELEGKEFTLQLFTDGITLVEDVPVTYDYPYREDGDTGPGTGGMGTHTMKDGLQPFVTEQDHSEAIDLMEKVLVKMAERGMDYKGVLYPTFFKTTEGLKMVEINARGGDPELINVLDLMDDNVDYSEVLRMIAQAELTKDAVTYKKMASAMLYLVSPEYGYGGKAVHEFTLDPDVIAAAGVKTRFASAVKVDGHQYKTAGVSRNVGLSAIVDGEPWDARARIDEAIREGITGPLVCRKDVASKKYIEGLKAA